MRGILLLTLIMLLAFPLCCADSVAMERALQNVTEHTWMYFQGYMDETRIFQTEPGFSGQKLVVGTRGSGTASRTQHSEIYGGNEYDEISFNEWGVFDYKPYNPPLTKSDLKNALCAKNYAVGSVFSESYSDIRDLVKDTNIYQDNQISVYSIDTELQGTARIGARVQRGPNTVPAYVMGGTYVGQLNYRSDIETGNSSILTLPCP